MDTKDAFVADTLPTHDLDEKRRQNLSKKEIRRLEKEAEKQRRKLLEEMHREQARAVMRKRCQLQTSAPGPEELEWRERRDLEWQRKVTASVHHNPNASSRFKLFGLSPAARSTHSLSTRTRSTLSSISFATVDSNRGTWSTLSIGSVWH